MLLHYDRSVLAAPSFATEGRPLPSVEAIAHPLFLFLRGFFCLYVCPSNCFATDRETFGGILRYVLWLDADPVVLSSQWITSSESTSWKSVAAWWMSLGSCLQCGVLAFCFRPEQISESYSFLAFIFLLLISDLRAWAALVILERCVSWLSSHCHSPEPPVQKVLQNKQTSSAPAAAATAIPPSLSTHHDWILPSSFHDNPAGRIWWRMGIITWYIWTLVCT